MVLQGDGSRGFEYSEKGGGGIFFFERGARIGEEEGGMMEITHGREWKRYDL